MLTLIDGNEFLGSGFKAEPDSMKHRQIIYVW